MKKRRTLGTRLRYVAAVARRFKLTLAFIAVWFIALPLLFVALYRSPAGQPVGYLQALHHVYFLLFGQPSLEFVDSVAIEVMNLLIPPIGLLAVVDGAVRFAYLFFAKHRAEKEWIEVIAETMRGHVIVCGAGRIGFRVATQLSELDREVVVIERKSEGPYHAALRDLDIPLLIDDARSHKALVGLNVAHASAIVCSTDDDLANINMALDARKLNKDIRIVMRLFDEDLVQRVRENFQAEAHSTSALAAHTLALSALDPRIVHSFTISDRLFVVSNFTVGEKLGALDVGQVRDRFGGLSLSLKTKDGAEMMHPRGNTPLKPGDLLTVQCRYEEYVALRQFTGEERPPLSLNA